MKNALALLPLLIVTSPAHAQLLSLDLDDLNALLGTLQGNVATNANAIAGIAADVSANAAAAASAAAQLGARIDLNDGAIALNAAAVADLQADAAATADAAALLGARVDANADAVVQLGARADLSDDAIAGNTADIADLQTETDILGDRIDANEEAVAQLALDVDTDLVLLDQRISETDVRVDTVSRQVQSIADGLLVRQDQPGGAITVGAASGGDSVDFAGTDGPRRLTGVAPGIAAGDMATVGQMNAADARTLAAAGDYTDSRFDAARTYTDEQIAAARSYTDQRVAAAGAGLRKELHAGIASAAALAGLPQPMLPGSGMFSAAIGGRGEVVAFAAGVSKSFRAANAPVVKAAVAVDTSGSRVTYNAGVGLHF